MYTVFKDCVLAQSQEDMESFMIRNNMVKKYMNERNIQFPVKEEYFKKNIGILLPVLKQVDDLILNFVYKNENGEITKTQLISNGVIETFSSREDAYHWLFKNYTHLDPNSYDSYAELFLKLY